MSLFRHRCGGSGAKCLESSLPISMPCASAPKRQRFQPSRGSAPSCGTRSAGAPCGPVLRPPCDSLRQDALPCWETRLEHFAAEAAQLRHLEPALEQLHREPSAWISGVPQSRCGTQAQCALAALVSTALFPPEEQSAELVGLPGTAANRYSCVMSRISLARSPDGAVAQMLSDIQAADRCLATTPNSFPTSSAAFSEGLGASGVPTLGRLPQDMARLSLGIDPESASMPHCCCPISTSEGQDRRARASMPKARQTFSPQYRLPPCSTCAVAEPAALRSLSTLIPAATSKPAKCFQHRRPLPKQRSILVELLAGLGLRHSLQPASQPGRLCAQPCHSESDQLRTTFPIMRSLVRASPAEPGFAVAWLEQLQFLNSHCSPENSRWVLFLSGAPGRGSSFSPAVRPPGTQGGRPSIPSTRRTEPQVRTHRRYVETLLQVAQPVQQQHRFPASTQELFTQKFCCSAIQLFDMPGSASFERFQARPTREERQDMVEDHKVQMEQSFTPEDNPP